MKKHGYKILVILFLILWILVFFPFGYRKVKNRYIPNLSFKTSENKTSMKLVTIRNYKVLNNEIKEINKHTKDKYIIKKGFIYNTIIIKYKK